MAESLKLSHLDKIYEDLIMRGVRPGETIPVTLVDNIIATRHGIGDRLMSNVKKKLVDFEYLKMSPTMGYFILLNKGPKKDPETELNEYLTARKETKPEG